MTEIEREALVQEKDNYQEALKSCQLEIEGQEIALARSRAMMIGIEAGIKEIDRKLKGDEESEDVEESEEVIWVAIGGGSGFLGKEGSITNYISSASKFETKEECWEHLTRTVPECYYFPAPIPKDYHSSIVPGKSDD